MAAVMKDTYAEWLQEDPRAFALLHTALILIVVLQLVLMLPVRWLEEVVRVLFR